MANTTVTAPATEREAYLQAFEREYQTTLRVLNNFPADKIQWKPSERSHSVAHVAWIQVMGQGVTEPVLTVPELKPGDAPPMNPPSDYKQIVAAYEQAHKDATTRLTAMTEQVFNSPIVMPIGPKGATATLRRADALWMFLNDGIHHRGQFSVYLRAVGGKVPSIYGPSGDEPWM